MHIHTINLMADPRVQSQNLTHEDCAYFVKGICTLQGTDADPKGHACEIFRPHREVSWAPEDAQIFPVLRGPVSATPEAWIRYGKPPGLRYSQMRYIPQPDYHVTRGPRDARGGGKGAGRCHWKRGRRH